MSAFERAESRITLKPGGDKPPPWFTGRVNSVSSQMTAHTPVFAGPVKRAIHPLPGDRCPDTTQL